MTDSNIKTVVFDNGSFMFKAGFAGEDGPRSVFPTMVGRTKNEGPADDPESQGWYVGEEARSKRALLDLVCPMERGAVTNWEAMERIWNHAFHQELNAAPEEHRVLLTEVPLIRPKANREKMTEMMFEKFRVAGMYVVNESVLSLYSSGRLTGIVVGSGDGSSNATPVHNGYAIDGATLRIDLAGRDLTDHILKVLTERGHPAVDRELAREVKESICRVALNFEKEMSNSSPSEKSYKLPDGQVIDFGKEAIRCPEALFRPSILGENVSGIHEMALDSIAKCDASLKKVLLGNVVLCGGTMLCRGFAGRMQKELAPGPGAKVKVVSLQDTEPSAWKGGSMLAQIPTLQQICISRRDYEEHGPSVCYKMAPKQ